MSIGAFDHELAREFIVVASVVCKVIKADVVIVMYRARERRVRRGSYLIITIIQPRCAMDE